MNESIPSKVHPAHAAQNPRRWLDVRGGMLRPRRSLSMSPAILLGSRQVVRHRSLEPTFGGSNPPSPASFRACYDRIVRRISRRPEGDDSLSDAAILQRTMNRLRGLALIPRGIYRFRDHEEADEWMIRTIAATHARLSSKTSSRFAKR